MKFAKAVRVIPGTFVLLALLTQSCPAQTSIGFENPGDTTNILEYRLPDWGYRTWGLDFSLGGNGNENYFSDENESFSHQFSTNLGSDFNLYRESEKRIGSLDASVSGSYQQSHSGDNSGEASGHDLNASYDLGGRLDQYLGQGPFFLGLAGDIDQGYRETIRESTGQDDYRRFDRGTFYGIGPAAGWGRLRDVTPLIRAQRLSERLIALGRPPLGSGQVQEIARVLATEQGYRTVFDRPDRSFWRDVLEPMLDKEHPLSPYEIFYLRDILAEDIGPRLEGAQLRGAYYYRERRYDSGSDDSRYYARVARLNFLWARNLSFNHQLTLKTGVNYNQSDESHEWDSGRSDSARWEDLGGVIDLAHLWTIADRYRLDTILHFYGSYYEAEYETGRNIERNLRTNLSSTFRVFLEDNMSLVAHVRGTNEQHYFDNDDTSDTERYTRSWNWSYGIGLEYYLDRFLY